MVLSQAEGKRLPSCVGVVLRGDNAEAQNISDSHIGCAVRIMASTIPDITSSPRDQSQRNPACLKGLICSFKDQYNIESRQEKLDPVIYQDGHA